MRPLTGLEKEIICNHLDALRQVVGRAGPATDGETETVIQNLSAWAATQGLDAIVERVRTARRLPGAEQARAIRRNLEPLLGGTEHLLGVLLIDPPDSTKVTQALTRLNRRIIIAPGEFFFRNDAAKVAAATRNSGVAVACLFWNRDRTTSERLVQILQQLRGAGSISTIVIGPDEASLRALCCILGSDRFLPSPLRLSSLVDAVSEELSQGALFQVSRAAAQTQKSDFLEAFQQIYLSDADHDGETALAIAGINGFKALQAACGTALADDVLGQVSRGLADGLRNTDMFMRWGAAEFILFFPGTSANDAALTLERAFERLQQQVRIPEAGQPYVSYSAGVVDFLEPSSLTAGVSRADRLRSMARAAGGSRVLISSSAPDQPLQAGSPIMADASTNQARVVQIVEFFEGAEDLSALAPLIQRQARPISLAILQVDRLITLDRTFGHETAANAVEHLTAVVSSSLRKSDLLARWKKGQFVAVLPRTPLSNALTAIDKALTALREDRFPLPDGRNLTITFSAGVSELSNEESVEEAIQRAQHYLSLARAGGGHQILPPDRPEDAGQRKVLILDFDIVDAELVKHRMEKAGYEVMHFRDGKKGLAAAMAEDWTLAILEIRMPQINGFEILKRIRKIPSLAGRPVILLTAAGGEKYVARGLRLGADDYVLKPFSPLELLARADRLIQRYRLQQQRLAGAVESQLAEKHRDGAVA